MLIWGTAGEGGGSIIKFCLKLTLLNFWIKLTQKGYFRTKKMKITIEFYIFKLIYNHFHNNLRLFDVLPNFPITTSETMCDYYLETWYIRVAARIVELLNTQDLRKLGNIRKVSTPHRMIAQYPVSMPKSKSSQYYQNLFKNRYLTFPAVGYFT